MAVKQPAISVELSRLSTKVDNVGKAIKHIHGNTVPYISWIPSLVISFLVVYPTQQVIIDTAPEYKFSAWLSGLIIDAKQATSRFALGLGVKFAGGSTTFASPLKGSLVVTSPYSSSRIHPVTGKVSPHHGTDYRCNTGDNVYAMRSGIVTHAEYTGKAGKMVIIEHSNAEKSVYMHLNWLSVGKFEKVATGEKIGTCGSTGQSTGPHLHVEIFGNDNKRKNPVTVIGISQPSDMWEYFKDTVAQSESIGSGGYTAISASGTYLGRYQMDYATINYAGYGHISKLDFVRSPKIQDKVYKSWQRKNIELFRKGTSICESGLHKLIRASSPKKCSEKGGIWVFVPGFLNDGSPAHKFAGALHAAQFGPVNALRWYSMGIDFADGNGVKISDYANRGEEAFKAKYGLFASPSPLLDKIERD